MSCPILYTPQQGNLMEQQPKQARLRGANGKSYLPSEEFGRLVPLAVLNEVAVKIHDQRVDRIVLPARIELDKNLLALLKSIKANARRALDERTSKLLRNAAAADVIQKGAVTVDLKRASSELFRFSEQDMRRIGEYVQASLSGPLRVEEMARHMGMNRIQFSRCFKMTTGTTPYQFVLEARVRAAKTLLTTSYQSLAEIAARTGFANASHFADVFQRLAHSSPSAYRARIFLSDAHVQESRQTQEQAGLPTVPVNAGAANAPASCSEEFLLEQTSLRINGEVRLLESSRGLGWTDLFAATTDELPHEGLRGVVPAVWIVTADSPNSILRVNAENQYHRTLPKHAISITSAGDAVYDELAFPLKARHVYLRQKVIDEVAQELFKDGRQRRCIQSSFGLKDPALFQLIAAIRSSLDQPRAGNQLKVDYLTLALATHLLTRHSMAGVAPAFPAHTFNSRQLGKISDYVNCNLSSDMNLHDLAKTVDLDRSQFIQHFKATTLLTPHQFVMLRRIGHARKLLASPSIDYEMIALACGFLDTSHFAATFKQVVGMTPFEYRRAACFENKCS
ncbi:MAG: AraC family transcriptional regulator [Burkholderiaceae bacterium]|jgi:transcriptional regulator GlxA family with amidase domain|nr:AraC family transcriptional regulator [Burkholderiaceae bacterium]